jgi:hypothetical protein
MLVARLGAQLEDRAGPYHWGPRQTSVRRRRLAAEEVLMDTFKFTQLIPVGSPPHAFYGLGDDGRLCWGVIKFSDHDGPPLEVHWTALQSTG